MKIADLHKAILPPTIQKVIKCLDKCPADEVFLMRQIASRAGVPYNSIRNSTAEDWSNGYRHLLGRNLWWGSKKAIAKLKDTT